MVLTYEWSQAFPLQEMVMEGEITLGRFLLP